MLVKKIFLIGIVVSGCAFALICACNLSAQNQTNKDSLTTKQKVVIREVNAAKSASIDAPEVCLKTFREFFSYVQQAKPDIAGDEKAQEHWLSVNLRKAMAKKIEFEDAKAKENPTDKREYPDNGSFVGAWDFPSTYTIVGSRLYENRAIIDVLYEWGDKTQYPGTKRLSSFIFIKVGDSWKLDDIYSFRGEFNSTESLSNYFFQGY